MHTCDEIMTAGTCPGHLAKFDDCVSEALFDCWGGADRTTGSADFEGSLAFFNISDPWAITLDEDEPTERTVAVPMGYYIVHELPGGGVALGKYRSFHEAFESFTPYEERFWRWEKGCEGAGHDACEPEDVCQLGGVPA